MKIQTTAILAAALSASTIQARPVDAILCDNIIITSNMIAMGMPALSTNIQDIWQTVKTTVHQQVDNANQHREQITRSITAMMSPETWSEAGGVAPDPVMGFLNPSQAALGSKESSDAKYLIKDDL